MSRPRRSRPNASSRLRVAGLMAAVAGALCVSAVEIVRAHEHKHTHQNLARASFRLLNSPVLVTGRYGMTTQQIENEIAQGVIDEDECIAVDSFAPNHDWDTATNWNSHFYEAKTHERLTIAAEVGFKGCNHIRFDTRTNAADRAQMLYTMAKDDYRAGHYKSAFRILGRMMHLMEDMTSPPHVTNDPHGGPTDCGGDNEYFERWGYCESRDSSPTHTRICEYFYDPNTTDPDPNDTIPVAFKNCVPPPATECIADFDSDGHPESYGVPRAGFQCRLWAAVHILYGGRPVSVIPGTNENPASAFIRQVANVTYDFTTFTVHLVDRENGDEEQPDSELQRMLRPSDPAERLSQCTSFIDRFDVGLCEARGGGWGIYGPYQQIGWSSGDLDGSNQNWWLMPTFYFKGDGRTEGFAYIENKGGDDEDNFIPLRYGCTTEENALPRSPCSERGLGVRSKKMYQQLYGTVQNAEDPFVPVSRTGKTLLRIYGDVLYPTAVAYGAGLIQAFVDDVTVAPTANAGGPYAGEACTALTFDASKSSDANGTIVSYAWDFTDDGTFDATTPASRYSYTYPSPFNGQARLRVTDNDGFTRDATADVEITPDVTPPAITKITATPNQLWPPNGQMTPVTIDVSLAGGCAGTCRITGVTSSEPPKGSGNGKNNRAEPDWVVTGPLTLQLRAERSGNVGSRVYTVEVVCVDAAGNTTTGNVVVTVPHDQRPSAGQRTVRLDFDGDGRADLAVSRPAVTTFWVRSSSLVTESAQLGDGSLGEVRLSGDIDGDGSADLAVWKPSTGTWSWLTSSNSYSSPRQAKFGGPGDVPMLADMDGDGLSDLVIWRPSTGGWYWLTSNSRFTQGTAIGFGGNPGDVPLTGDADGDGKADLIIWRPDGFATFYVLLSSANYSYSTGVRAIRWGTSGDQPFAGDLDGDGKIDFAVWRPRNGTWYWTSANGYSLQGSVQWGVSTAGDIPILADFDGDGRLDIAVWRSSTGTWYWLKSTLNYSTSRAGVVAFGGPGDLPIVR